ncbi:GPI transamidase component GPI16 [Fulvia fulva]|nr:GPI transamidase component GPI16 [Fulvia fulva]KAK4637201.1 GPI transamidase component GPI16 [Fulvia fulva]WPV08317.1 GPI transamidase component GPI16 [Fulvia fulva]WPV25065.1 GPI transamidase component GPI16 [Fulvia fulva]
MCKYYAHTHPCGHTKTVFAAFCPQSALIQKPCGRGEIWATVKMDKDSGLVATIYSATASAANSYNEHLHLKPLPNGALYAGFNFTASTPLSAYDAQHFRFFPRSLGQILQFTHTSELHLRFALGRWDEESWGSRPRNGRREGGTGVELWAWLEGDSQAEAEERWSGLVNSLSGLFCASLNFIDQSKTIRPILSFEPEGDIYQGKRGKDDSTWLMHGMLPHEVVCTENLTPFLKLLPCKGKAGVSSLLDGHKVFDANWQTMAIDVRPKRGNGIGGVVTECELEIEQTVDMVLDVERSMRPRDNPIPRPLPIEEITCDPSKDYNSQDTCFPKRLEGEMEWSLSRIFGRPMQGSCPVGDRQNTVDITLDVPLEREVELVPEAALISALRSETTRFFTIEEGQEFDLKLPQQTIEQPMQHDRTLLSASRQMTGYGQERGGMHTLIINPAPHAQMVVFLESLPWFLRPYMHTLKISGAKTEKMYYRPAIDRQKGTHFELLLDVPAQSTVELTYDFEKAILRYTEYPPDANRGFDIPPAIIRVLPRDGEQDRQGNYLRTTSLLLPLPTPDFSMPYNVIILTSTVIALGFGSIFNLLIRRFVLAEEVPKSPIAGVVQNVIAKAKAAVAKTKQGKAEDKMAGATIPTVKSSEAKVGSNGLDTVRERKGYANGKVAAS